MERRGTERRDEKIIWLEKRREGDGDAVEKREKEK